MQRSIAIDFSTRHMPRPKFDKKDWLLLHGATKFTKPERDSLHIDDEGLFSTTPFIDGIQIADRIASLPGIRALGRKPVITDGCACCGGNVMQFICSGNFDSVVAVEFDPERTRNCLQWNVDKTYEYRPNNTHTRVICDSYITQMQELQQDVVFLDPPWGGPSYHESNHTLLVLGGMDISEIVSSLYAHCEQNKTKYVVLKAPTNFDYQSFSHTLRQVSDRITIHTERMRDKYCVHYINFGTHM